MWIYLAETCRFNSKRSSICRTSIERQVNITVIIPRVNTLYQLILDGWAGGHARELRIKLRHKFAPLPPGTVPILTHLSLRCYANEHINYVH